MFGVNSIHHRIFDFVGIGQYIGGIETQNIAEVVDASYVVVAQARLDHVLPFASKPGSIENLGQRGRPQFN